MVNSYYETKDIQGYGKIKLLVREVELFGRIIKTMPMTSQSMEHFEYHSEKDLIGRGSPLYRKIKELYPDCTPHHDNTGYHVVPTVIHRAFKHDGTVIVKKLERENMENKIGTLG